MAAHQIKFVNLEDYSRKNTWNKSKFDSAEKIFNLNTDCIAKDKVLTNTKILNADFYK